MADEMRKGGGVYKQDLVLAKKWYQFAIDAGSVRAFYGLGLINLYYREYSQAIYHLEKASEYGYAPAMGALGSVHFKGLGVDRDKRKGEHLWRRASELGHLNSRMILVSRQVRGHYGVRGFIEGLLNLFPVSFDHAKTRSHDPDSERLS
ncbi:MAG: tetratricopeptide repeat protein [Brevundimonas sp.]